MKSTHEQIRGCHHKVRFPDRHRAKMAVRTIRNNKSKPTRMRAYECEYCNGWHLTSKKGA